MTGFETASLVIAAANASAAVTAAAGIWHGIRAMVRANKDRAAILDRQREADERRHAEAMRAAGQRHAEAMQAGAQRHAEAMAALERQGAALDELIRASQRQGEALERQGAALDALLRRPAPGAPAE